MNSKVELGCISPCLKQTNYLDQIPRRVGTLGRGGVRIFTFQRYKPFYRAGVFYFILLIFKELRYDIN